MRPYFRQAAGKLVLGSMTGIIMNTADEAVQVMARVQVGSTLTDDETHKMVAFLRSLTGPLPSNFATESALPPGAVRSGAALN